MNPYGEGGGQFSGYGGAAGMANHGMLSMGMLQSLEQMMGGGTGEYVPAVVGGGMIFSGTQEQMPTAGGTSTMQQTAAENLVYEHRSFVPGPVKTESTGSGRTPASSNGGGPPSRYESQKRRDWNTFGQYLSNHRPPLALSRCSGAHVLEFLRYLDKFGKTKVHAMGCPFFGHPQPPAPCACPLRQAWGSLDALIGRLRAAYEENGGRPESNPFGARAVRLYLREVREIQAKARGIAYEKKKRKRPPPPPAALAAAHTPDHAIAAASASNSCVTTSPMDRSPHYTSMPPPSSSASATSGQGRQSLLSDSSSLLIPSFNGSFN